MAMLHFWLLLVFMSAPLIPITTARPGLARPGQGQALSKQGANTNNPERHPHLSRTPTKRQLLPGTMLNLAGLQGLQQGAGFGTMQGSQMGDGSNGLMQAGLLGLNGLNSLSSLTNQMSLLNAAGGGGGQQLGGLGMGMGMAGGGGGAVGGNGGNGGMGMGMGMGMGNNGAQQALTGNGLNGMMNGMNGMGMSSMGGMMGAGANGGGSSLGQIGQLGQTSPFSFGTSNLMGNGLNSAAGVTGLGSSMGSMNGAMGAGGMGNLMGMTGNQNSLGNSMGNMGMGGMSMGGMGMGGMNMGNNGAGMGMGNGGLSSAQPAMMSTGGAGAATANFMNLLGANTQGMSTQGMSNFGMDQSMLGGGNGVMNHLNGPGLGQGLGANMIGQSAGLQQVPMNSMAQMSPLSSQAAMLQHLGQQGLLQQQQQQQQQSSAMQAGGYNQMMSPTTGLVNMATLQSTLAGLGQLGMPAGLSSAGGIRLMPSRVLNIPVSVPLMQHQEKAQRKRQATDDAVSAMASATKRRSDQKLLLDQCQKKCIPVKLQAFSGWFSQIYGNLESLRSKYTSVLNYVDPGNDEKSENFVQPSCIRFQVNLKNETSASLQLFFRNNDATGQLRKVGGTITNNVHENIVNFQAPGLHIPMCLLKAELGQDEKYNYVILAETGKSNCHNIHVFARQSETFFRFHNVNVLPILQQEILYSDANPINVLPFPEYCEADAEQEYSAELIT